MQCEEAAKSKLHEIFADSEQKHKALLIDMEIFEWRISEKLH